MSARVTSKERPEVIWNFTRLIEKSLLRMRRYDACTLHNKNTVEEAKGNSLIRIYFPIRKLGASSHDADTSEIENATLKTYSCCEYINSRTTLVISNVPRDMTLIIDSHDSWFLLLI